MSTFLLNYYYLYLYFFFNVIGHGKTHKDAASVRATHPIPAACGLYYFEVKIVSKGRDGYMGIGLSAQGVNMNRLPGGWFLYSRFYIYIFFKYIYMVIIISYVSMGKHC